MNLDSIPIHHNEAARRFEADLGDALAVAAYRRSGDMVIFTHTEVPSGYEGQGVGEKLVRSALDTVRSEGLRVVPLCPFVRHFIETHPTYQDLVAR